eukprot:COSAG06_NODE_11761_length_1468_cov_1.788897_2_plen_356_part_01
MPNMRREHVVAQRAAEISAVKGMLREVAEALDPNDERRTAVDLYMAVRELREHATAEVQAHSDSLEATRAKLEAAREQLADVSVQAEIPKAQLQQKLPADKEEKKSLLIPRREHEERERDEADLTWLRMLTASLKEEEEEERNARFAMDRYYADGAEPQLCGALPGGRANAFGGVLGRPLAGGSGMPVKSSDSPPELQDERRLQDPVLPGPGGARRAYDHWLVGNAGSRPFQRSLPPGHEGKIMLWDLGAEDPEAAGGPRRLVLEGHEGMVYGVSFSPDSRTLASCSYDRTILLWDLGVEDPAAASPRVLKGHEETVNGVSFSPDGHTLASCSGDCTIMLWDMGAEDPEAAGGPRV